MIFLLQVSFNTHDLKHNLVPYLRIEHHHILHFPYSDRFVTWNHQFFHGCKPLPYLSTGEDVSLSRYPNNFYQSLRMSTSPPPITSTSCHSSSKTIQRPLSTIWQLISCRELLFFGKRGGSLLELKSLFIGVNIYFNQLTRFGAMLFSRNN